MFHQRGDTCEADLVGLILRTVRALSAPTRPAYGRSGTLAELRTRPELEQDNGKAPQSL